MAAKRDRPLSVWTKEGGLAALILLQAGCAFVFVSDIAGDVRQYGLDSLHLSIELVANLGLIAAIAIEARLLLSLLRRQERSERALSAAQGAMAELMRAHFTLWRLTPAEADVAGFTIKGFSVAETAELRGSGEATVKSQLNAVYRKAGVSGRAQLVSIFVEELFAGPIRSDAEPQQVPKRSRNPR